MTVSLTKRDRRDTVSAQTFTRTTHYVHVDLADLLGQFGFEDEVILTVGTPSGRDQRVTVRRNLLVPAHHDTGYGTCDSCGSVNIAVNNDRLCKLCR
jgi:hypothetical protein